MYRLLGIIIALLITSPTIAADFYTPVHAIAMQGKPKYPADFKHFDYVNAEAPKNGLVKLAAVGTFDNLNPFILKGVAATGAGMLFDSLLESSADEAFTEYGLLAESVEMPENRAWVIFNLRPEAKFSDGTSVTADDVAFTFETLKTKGNPLYRVYYANVSKVDILGPRKVKFTFGKDSNRELPLIVGQMQVLSKTYYTAHKFDETTLVAPLGSGPYKVESVDPGRSITFARDPNYWGKNLPINKGRYNFERIRYDYYRDGQVALEAFKAGEYDFRQENVAKDWATAYDFPALSYGLVKKEEIPHEIPTGMQGFAMNTRRALFSDPAVRQALGYAFDFEWSNKALFFGSYTRTRSYFSNSELASVGLPSADEIKVLEKYRAVLPEEVFTKEYVPPMNDGSGNIRNNLKIAQKLLADAGWEMKDGVLMKDGKKFEFEVISNTPMFERILLPFKNNLQKLGITANIRTIDSAQYQKRMEDFDYDMTVIVIPQSLSPGNEQRNFWSSSAADTRGSDNYMGIKNPAVDELVEKIIAATTREELITYTRALDRILLWGYYVIPNWHIRTHRVAYWDKFSAPSVRPKYALGFLDTWWIDADKQAKLETQKQNPGKTLMPSEEGKSRKGAWLLVALLALLGLAFIYNRRR
ncbi:MAG: ABC transporter substrate-binding protein [Alphaproteobacteria bacterium]|nr:MAG: ABC transporter substrate-binding protein [Alphaproteobacteria bacterium]